MSTTRNQTVMKTLTCLLLVGAFAPVLHAQQPGELSYHDESIMPQGIVGERIDSMIETFNSGNPERVQQFLQDEATSVKLGNKPTSCRHTMTGHEV